MTTLLLVACLAPSVRAQQSPDEDGQREPFVNKILFVGNEFFSARNLKDHMTTKESPFFSIFRKPRLRRDFLQRDIAALAALYHANGFLEASVTLAEVKTLENEAFVDIIIHIKENEATRVAQVTFRNPGVFDEKTLSKGLLLEHGDPYNPAMLAADVYSIKKHYFEKGFLAVGVTDSVSVEDKRVRIFYDIVPGPVIHIRGVRFVGNKLTRTPVISKELTFKAGDVFSLHEAVETQRNLFETGLFTEADIIPENLDIDARLVDIIVRVRERKAAYVEFGFGVGNVLGSRVVGEWGDRNLFGTGRLLRFKTEYSFGFFTGDGEFQKFDPRVKFYRYDGEFGQRRFFGTKVLLGLNAFVEKDATVEDIVIRTRGASLAGSRRLGEYTLATVRLSQERIKRETLDLGDDKSTSNLIATTMSYDTRDFILDAKRGVYRDATFEVAGGILGGDNDFYTTSVSYQRYLAVGGASVLALRTRAGFADAFAASASSGVPIENRFFTGGGNSVRGYGENRVGPTAKTTNAQGDLVETVIGGRALLLTNVELRFPLPLLSRHRFSGAIFADGGNVWASLGSISLRNFRPYASQDKIEQQDYRYAVGLGVRYNTPVGPIRLDYGFPVKREAGVSSSGRIHFSLGQMF